MCDPLHVWTAPTWIGLDRLEISKILIPLNLSGLESLFTPSSPQSILLLFSSTDIIRRSSTIETSPWPPGHTTEDTKFGIPSAFNVYILNP